MTPEGIGRRWRARWIWAAGDGLERNVRCLFRREVEIRGSGEGVHVHVTADTRYELHVNGRFVGRGAPQSQPYWQYYDTLDLGRFLRPGGNCIGVIVHHLGTIPDTRGGLLLEIVDAGGAMLLGTDASWRVTPGWAWARSTYAVQSNRTTPFQEVFDARAFPWGWSEPEFDDGGWARATIISGRISDRPPAVTPWTCLVPRDIPRMRETAVLPTRVERVEECLWLASRARPEDLSIELSLPGRPVELSSVEDAESLVRGDGRTVVSGSLAHEDRVFDGIYDPCIILDFGRVVTAYPRLELEGPAGAAVDVGYAERLVEGHFVNSLEGQFADRYVTAGGAEAWQPSAWKAFRFLKLRFRHCRDPLCVKSVKAVATTYPYEERGRFRSSDPVLERVFEISRRTISLCSNEFLMDTPWREQAQWLGDVSAVTLGGIYACFGDAAMPAKFLRQSGRNPVSSGLLAHVTNVVAHGWQGMIPDYSLWWVMALWEHYLYTGDAGVVHELYPRVADIIRTHWQYLNEHGLIEDMPYWVFIDWADVDRRGECAAYNAIFRGAMGAARGMAALKGDSWMVSVLDEAISRMKASFQPRLFDPARGLFADARVDDELSPKTSEHANAAAIRFGLCDDATAREVVRRLFEERPAGETRATEAQPFFMVVVLKALRMLGRTDLALDLIRERWGGRMVDRGATSTFEEWGMNGSWRDGTFRGFMRTHSHAWSACPAEFLIHDLAGITIVEPGCAKLRVSPAEVGLDYEVAYPTPRGEVVVRCQGGRAAVAAPPGVTIVEP